MYENKVGKTQNILCPPLNIFKQQYKNELNVTDIFSTR